MSQSGKSQTVTEFYLAYVHLLPHLARKKRTSFFCIFYQTTKQKGFFLYWKTWEILEFPQKIKFCSNLQNGAESLNVCINCLLFTPFDYIKKFLTYMFAKCWYSCLLTKYICLYMYSQSALVFSIHPGGTKFQCFLIYTFFIRTIL